LNKNGDENMIGICEICDNFIKENKGHVIYLENKKKYVNICNRCYFYYNSGRGYEDEQ